MALGVLLLRYRRGRRTDVLVPGQAPAGQGSRRRGRSFYGRLAPASLVRAASVCIGTARGAGGLMAAALGWEWRGA